jgi:hypothetical protein
MRDCFEHPSSENIKSLKWSCKMRAAADKHINLMLLCIFLGATAFVAIFLNGIFDRLPKDMGYLYVFCGSMYFSVWLFSLIVRQKTVYHYAVHADKGECESYLYFPKWASTFFNAVGGGVIFVFFIAALLTGSLLPLIGAGALGLGYAGRLIGWKNEIKLEQSELWIEYKFVTLDYKRKMIVAHWSDITVGFELRCQTQERFDECWAFFKTVLREDVEILVRRWDAADAYRLNI